MAIDNPLAPAWLMDLQGGGGPQNDPLLDALEEERRRRNVASQPDLTYGPPAPSIGGTVASQPAAAPMPTVPSEPAVDPGLDLARRNAEADANMAQARVADQEAAGVTADGGLHPSRQLTDGGLTDPSSVHPSVHAWDPMVYAASQAYGVPVNVIQAIIDIESKGDPSATSGADARGLMQVLGSNAQGGEDLYDPATNIGRGTAMLAERYARYGTWEQAVASYFGAIDANGQITSASDGNTDGYGYVDAFSTKANAYARELQDTGVTYGPSIPGYHQSNAGASAQDYGDQRPSQLPSANPDLSIAQAYADCGPAAAIVFAAMAGRAPTLHEAQDMATRIKAWDEGIGMYGPDAEIRLIQALGGSAKFAAGLDPGTLIREVGNGNPVIVDSPGHYGVISGFDPESNRFYFGTSATDLKGGSPWMTLEAYQQLNANQGPIRGMLLVDNPLSHGPSDAINNPGPSLPRNFHPDDPIKRTPENDPDLAASRKEMEAAQELARQVNLAVQKAQDKARAESEQARVTVEPLAQPAQTVEQPNAPDLSLLKQPLADASGGRSQAEEPEGFLQSLASGPVGQFIANLAGHAGNRTRESFGLPEDPNAPQPAQPELTGPLGFVQTFSNNAAHATVGIVSSLDSYANGALSAAGFGDTQAAHFFQTSRDYFDAVNQNDPRFKADEVDVFNPATYTNPSSYAAIAGQLLPSILGAMATGGAAGALLGEGAAAAPLISRLPALGTRAEALGSALFTLPTAAGSTYEDLKKLGASDKEAFIGANISGALQSALEVINPHEGLPVIRRLFAAGADAERPFLQRILGAARELAAGFLKEGSEEASQQFADNAVQKWFGSDKSWFDQVPESFIIGGIGGLGTGAVGAGHTILGHVSPEARLRHETGLTPERVEVMAKQVTDLDAARAFLTEQAGHTAEYARASGFNPRETELAQERARILVLQYGAQQEARARGLVTDEQLASDPKLMQAVVEIGHAQYQEQRLADKRGYEADQRIAARGPELQAELARRGIGQGAEATAGAGGVVLNSEPPSFLVENHPSFLTKQDIYRDSGTETSYRENPPKVPQGTAATPPAASTLSGMAKPGSPESVDEGARETTPPLPLPAPRLAGMAVGPEPATQGATALAPSLSQQVIPRTTATTGGFEAPGLEQGPYQRPEPGRVWEDIKAEGQTPVVGAEDVKTVGRAGTPNDMLVKVANRAYAAAFARSAQRLLTVGEQGRFRPAMAIVQSIADRVLGGQQPRVAPKVGHILVGVQETYGWTDLDQNQGVAISPAELFHNAVINVAEEERRGGRPFSDQERREKIIRGMAFRQVQTILHEAVHHWGEADESVGHGPEFKKLDRPIEHVFRLLDSRGGVTGISLDAIDTAYGLETGTARKLVQEIREAVRSTAYVLRQTFGTVQGQGDQLAQLNADAQEQRLLARIPRSNDAEQQLPTGGDHGPDGGPERGGPLVHPGASEGNPLGIGPGTDAGGLRGSEGDTSLGAQPEGADGLGPELGPVERSTPGPAEPGAGEQNPGPVSPAEPVPSEQPAAGPTAPAFEPGPDAESVNAQLGGQLDALREAIVSQADSHTPDQIAAQLDAVYGEQREQIDPKRLLGALGFDSKTPLGQFVRQVMGKFYGASPTWMAAVMERRIRERAPREWSPGEITLELKIPKDNVALAVRINEILKQRGVLHRNDLTVRPGEQVAPAEAPGAPADLNPQTGPETPLPSPEPSVAPPASTESQAAPTARSRAVGQTVATAQRFVANDAEIVGFTSGDHGTAKRYGQQLSQELTVDGNPEQTQHNQQAVVESTFERKDELSAERRRLEAERTSLTDESIPVPERDHARLKEITARVAAIRRISNNLASILNGLGRSARSSVQQGEVRELLPDRNGKPVLTPNSKWSLPLRGQLQAVVRGLGATVMNPTTTLTARRSSQNPLGVNEESRRALNVLAEAISKVRRSGFVDHEGNTVSMSDWLNRSIEIFYAGESVTTERFMADAEQLAQALIEQHPDMDVEQPEMLGILLQAFSSMTQDAFAKVQAAAKEDRDSGTQNQLVRDAQGKALIDPITKKQIRGPKQYEALQAMEELMRMSTLLPSIKKIATTSGRNLRVMQMAEARHQARSHLEVLQGFDNSVKGLVDMLTKVQAEIKGGRNALDVLTRYKLLNRQGAGPGPGRDPLRLFDEYFDAMKSFSDIEDQLGEGSVEKGLLTEKLWQQIKDRSEQEREFADTHPGERLFNDAEVRAIIEQVRAGLGQVQRRLYNRRINPETGVSYQTESKAAWRAPDRENYALELVKRRLESLSEREVEAFRQQVREGLSPDNDRFWNEPASAGAEYTRAELRAHLLEKAADITSWQAQNDPASNAYQRAHPRRAGAMAGTIKTVGSLQQEMGEAYRDEIALDHNLPFARSWLQDARDGRTADDPAKVEALVREMESDLARARLQIADAQSQIIGLVFNDLFTSLDVSEIKRTELEDKLTQHQIDAIVAQNLGLAVQQRMDREMLAEALANREIGKVDREVRRLMHDHYHSTYDERLEAEQWVRFVEGVEKEFGESQAPNVQAKVQEIRDRAYQAVVQLDTHPVHGEPMARALLSRMTRAVHGDAGQLVSGIQQSLTSSGYLVDGERHPDYNDLQALRNRQLLEELAGTESNPAPLALTLENPYDQQAYLNLVVQLDHVVTLAPAGLGQAFKDAILAAVDVSHQRSAILDMLPMVEANPTDAALRYVVETQLYGLKQTLGNRETEPWFRRRYGTAEISLRNRYEQAVERGAARLDRRAEQAAEAANTYDALVNLGVATQADFEKLQQDGTPGKKSASELIVERLERQKADAIRSQIVAITTEYWEEPDARRRDLLQTLQDRLMGRLEQVGAYTDADGKEQGIGRAMAARLSAQILDKHFKEEERQGTRQQGWDQQAEIASLVREIREVHRYLLKGDPGSPENQQLQQEISDLFSDLRAVGATETDPRLKEMGIGAAEKLISQLDLKTIRFNENETDRVDRRRATDTVREIRERAMTAVRDLVTDPQSLVARRDLYAALGEMAQVVYVSHEDIEIVDRDPTNGGITGKRTERQEVTVPYGLDQATRIRDMVDIRIGSSLEDLGAMASRTDLDRAQQASIGQAIHDRITILAQAARRSDDLSQLDQPISEMLEILGRLGKYGQGLRTKEQQRLQQTGFTRMALHADEETRKQTAQFFAMIQPTTDRNGAIEYNPRSVGHALRLVTAPNWADYYREYGVIAMLGSPTTWGPLGVNSIGQLLNVVVQPTRYGVKLATDMARHALFGSERTTFASEAGAAVQAVDWMLIKRASKAYGETILFGHSSEQMRRAGETGDLHGLRSEFLVDALPDHGPMKIFRYLAIAGHMGSLRILKASDEFIGTLVYEMAYAGQLERKAQQTGQTVAQVQNNIHDLADVVEKTGKVRSNVLFQEHGKLLSVINHLARPSSMASKTSRNGALWQLADGVAATYLPFTTVPYNALKQSAQLSGLGFLAYSGLALHEAATHQGGAEGAKRRLMEQQGLTDSDLAGFDASAFFKAKSIAESERMTDYLSKAALGAMVQLIGWWLASAGLITGDEPDDPTTRGVDQTEQLPPRSVYIYLPGVGGRWYSYDSTPFAVPFAISANIAQNWKLEWARISKQNPSSEVNPWTATGSAALSGTGSAIFNNFFLENTIQAASALMGIGHDTATNNLYKAASPLVTRNLTPAYLAYLARQGDTVERDTRSDSLGGRLVNLGESRLPGWRETVPVKLNLLGQETPNIQPKWAGLFDYSRVQTAHFDQLFRILEKYDATSGLKPATTVLVPDMKNGTFELTPEEQQIWQREFGAHLKTEVARTYNNPDFNAIYNVAPGQDKAVALQLLQKQRMKQAVERAKAFGNTKVLQANGATSEARMPVLNPRIAEWRKKQATNPTDAPEP